jgi:hypothetical protein
LIISDTDILAKIYRNAALERKENCFLFKLYFFAYPNADHEKGGTMKIDNWIEKNLMTLVIITFTLIAIIAMYKGVL